MKNIIAKIGICYLFFWTLSIPNVYGQIWPGDIDDNGVVDHIDFLYWGDAVFTGGEPRTFLEQGGDWNEKVAPNPWITTFPSTGLDYSYADCDGNGVVDFGDKAIIEINYGLEHGTPVLPNYPTGVPNVDPQLFFDTLLSPFDLPFLENMFYPIPVSLGTEDIPVNDFHGIAFTVEYDPNILKVDQLIFAAANDSWISPNTDALEFVNTDELGKIKVSVVRGFGPPVSGAGPIGVLFIIIEDHVVSVANPSVESFIEIKDIILFDPEFNINPVVADTLEILIVEEDFTLATTNKESDKILIQPNPVKDVLYIQSKDNQIFETARIFNAMGQQIWFQNLNGSNQINLAVTEIPDGIYIVQIESKRGMVSKKILIQNN